MSFDELMAALSSASESTCTEGPNTWGMVYLDNARPTGFSRHAFAGLLSSLERLGYYRKTGDRYFGEILLAGPALDASAATLASAA